MFFKFKEIEIVMINWFWGDHLPHPKYRIPHLPIRQKKRYAPVLVNQRCWQPNIASDLNV